MKRFLQAACGGLLAAAFALPAQTAVIDVNLQGKAGPGLLPGSENVPIIFGEVGSGGEFGTGIRYDDVTNMMTLNVNWGQGNNHNNLTGNVTVAHIHGPTPSSGPAAFLENAGVLINLHTLPGFNASRTNGGLTNGMVTLTEMQEAQLLAGRLYINFHTALNPDGEIRGNLVPIPEPGTYAMILAGLGLMGFMARRRMQR
jgi:hypothetical protein